MDEHQASKPKRGGSIKGKKNQDGSSAYANKRNDVAKEQDRATMMKLLRRGYTQGQIAEVLKISNQQVSYDFKLVISNLRGEMLEDTKDYVAQKLAEYAEIKREAWEAWERSKLDAQKSVVETAPPLPSKDDKAGTKKGKGDKGQAADVSVKALRMLKKVETTEGRLPSSDYLRIIAQCIAAERELLGIDPPKEIGFKGNIVNWDLLARNIPSGPVPDEIEGIIAGAMGLPAPTETEVAYGDSDDGGGQPERHARDEGADEGHGQPKGGTGGRVGPVPGGRGGEAANTGRAAIFTADGEDPVLPDEPHTNGDGGFEAGAF